MEEVTLVYDWTFFVEGYFFADGKPIEIKGRTKKTITYDGTKTQEEQLNEIKKKMKEDIECHCRQNPSKIPFCQELQNVYTDSVTFSNVREATKWTDLEDFCSSE